MSSNSVVGRPITERLPNNLDDATSDPLAWTVHPVETGTAWLYKNATKSDPPDSKTPGAPPTQQGANQVALQDQLNQEMNTRQSRTGFGASSGGLLDGQPQTASRVLLGS